MGTLKKLLCLAFAAILGGAVFAEEVYVGDVAIDAEDVKLGARYYSP